MKGMPHGMDVKLCSALACQGGKMSVVITIVQMGDPILNQTVIKKIHPCVAPVHFLRGTSSKRAKDAHTSIRTDELENVLSSFLEDPKLVTCR